jgi:hypothetical protein
VLLAALGGAAVLVGVLGRPVPLVVSPGPIDCGSAPTAVRFCPSLPSFQPPDEVPLRIADQIRPCDDQTSFRPSFCVALPAGSAGADHATLVARRQDACTQLGPGDAPGFCLVVPSDIAADASLEREAALVLLRQRLGSDFRHANGGELELWVESGVPSEVADRVDSIMREDAAAVQAYFGRQFRDTPAVFLFASQGSFALALERQFGYSPGLAAQLSSQYGGLLVSGIGVIVINGQNVLGGPRPTIFRHELTHAMAHQLAGVGLPFWFDEGLATLAAAPDAASFDLERATALSILGDEVMRSITFDEGRSWFERNTALGGNAYGVAAEAVRLMVEPLDRGGLTAMLEAIGRGASLDSVYQTKTGESLALFVQRLPDRLLAGCRRGISLAGPRPDGLVLWRIYGFGSQRSVAITADGPSHYAFAVTTDRYGVYTGTLGGPMPRGAYDLHAYAEGADAVRITVAVGDPSAPPSRACGG